MLDDRSIGRHGGRLRELAAVAMLDSPLARSVWSAEWLLGCARAGAWDELLVVAPELGRRWAWRRAHEVVPLAAVNRVLRKLSKLQVVLRRRGSSVALLGPDGAGKSTLAEGLAASFYHPARSFYGGLSRLGRPLLWRKGSFASSIVFPLGLGTLVLNDGDVYDMNNPTSSKQNVSPATGMVVLAGNDHADRYWLHYHPLVPLPASAEFASTATAKRRAVRRRLPGPLGGRHLRADELELGLRRRDDGHGAGTEAHLFLATP